MTTELTKAAQQALEALKLCYAVVEYPANGTSRQDKAIAALERALTQRPAAQEGDEEEFIPTNDFLGGHQCGLEWAACLVEYYAPRTGVWFYDDRNDLAAAIRKGPPDMPAPQQATPATPEDMKVYDGIAAGYFADAQQATPDRHLTVTTNRHGDAVMVSWQDDEHRILEVVWERDPATPEPVGWTDADADAARLAMELECLLLDTKDTAAVSRWWKSANEALDLHRARLAAAQAKGGE